MQWDPTQPVFGSYTEEGLIGDASGILRAQSKDGSTRAFVSGSSVEIYRRNPTDMYFELVSTDAYNPTEQISWVEHWTSVALSENGTCVAIGRPLYTDENSGLQVGGVWFHSFDEVSNTYTLAGPPAIVGSLGEGLFGSAVSLNNDGSLLAVGATGLDYAASGTFPEGNGFVRVFQHTSQGSWLKLGEDMFNQRLGSIQNSVNNNYEYSELRGQSVAIQGTMLEDNIVVAVGAPRRDGLYGNKEVSGSFAVFTYVKTSDSWIPLGEEVFNEALCKYPDSFQQYNCETTSFGVKVQLSDVARTIAVLAPLHRIPAKDPITNEERHAIAS